MPPWAMRVRVSGSTALRKGSSRPSRYFPARQSSPQEDRHLREFRRAPDAAPDRIHLLEQAPNISRVVAGEIGAAARPSPLRRAPICFRASEIAATFFCTFSGSSRSAAAMAARTSRSNPGRP